jgi:hypothetical protein
MLQDTLADRSKSNIGSHVLPNAHMLHLIEFGLDIGRAVPVYPNDAGCNALHDLPCDQPFRGVRRGKLIVGMSVGVNQARRNHHRVRIQRLFASNVRL